MPQAMATKRMKGENLSKRAEMVRGCPYKRKESRDSANGGSYGDGTSMVCGECSKTCW